MIKDEKHRAALSAINSVLVIARAMAYDGSPHADIAEVLDTAEYLPMLMLESRDRTNVFRGILEELAAKFPQFAVALQKFDED